MTIKITVKGAVQGVGYRPFIANKATEYDLKGYVKNIGAAVEILVSGDENKVYNFAHLVETEYPTGAFILDVQKEVISDTEARNRIDFFVIIESEKIDLGSELPVFLPDIGICDDCLNEMLDKSNRRYRYPLISCASCGPRFSILNSLPYDRDTTTMVDFEMCPSCKAEYLSGRRRHAQTISCFDCGPQYMFKESACGYDITGENAIDEAVKLLMEDKVIGLKGVSGYQLICRPNDNAALRLRKIKLREEKPFAVMFSEVDGIAECAKVNSKEKELLTSSSRPIVLLETLKPFPYEVSRDSRYIGAFLPSAGIHRLLCDAVGPLIVTSANKSEEPIIIDDNAFIEAFLDEGYYDDNRVSGVLYHTRKINIPQDDSVVFALEIANKGYLTCFIRRARGYAPLPVLVKNGTNNVGIISFGGDLKNTFSLAKKDKVILSQFLGDIQELEINKNERRLVDRLVQAFEFRPEMAVCDMHPLYESTRIAEDYAYKNSIPLYKVQHHHAHILSVMAEKCLKSCIGISFDGTGFGTDENIWGGEILYCQGGEYQRKGHLAYVKLCGGDNAPKNAALVKQCYYYSADPASAEVTDLVKAALKNNIKCFNTSSMGRLFDCISSLLGIKDVNSFEGECATLLEKKAFEYDKSEEDLPQLNFYIDYENGQYIINQIKTFEDIAHIVQDGKYSKEAIAYSFHIAIARVVIDICRELRKTTGENMVCLSGGVFANRLLLKSTFEGLMNEGFEVYTNEIVPCGDSGISLGQAYYGMLGDL